MVGVGIRAELLRSIWRPITQRPWPNSIRACPNLVLLHLTTSTHGASLILLTAGVAPSIQWLLKRWKRHGRRWHKHLVILRQVGSLLLNSSPTGWKERSCHLCRTVAGAVWYFGVGTMLLSAPAKGPRLSF